MSDADPIDKRPPAPIRLEWELSVAASLEKTWQEFSDTDRFNRAAGFDFKFNQTVKRDGSLDRVGTVKRFGLELRWEERSFDFEAPRYFRVERVFRNGPLALYTVTTELMPMGGRTRVRYRVHAWPRNVMTRPLMEIEFRGFVRRQIDRTLRALVRHIEGEETAFDPRPPPLAQAVQNQLGEMLQRVSPPEVADALSRFLCEAPLHEQARMRPLSLAREWGIDANPIIDGFLSAVREGALAMTWDLLCPSCDGAGARIPQLGSGPTNIHCDSCNIRYDASFSDSLEVTFHPTSAVRDARSAIRCVGSPGRTPHVIARSRLAPGEEATWNVDLPAGSYRLRALSSLEGAGLEVAEGGIELALSVDVTPQGVQPLLLRAPAGEIGITLRSRLPVVDWFVLERRWRFPDTLTAGRLLERPGAKGLLPDGALAPGVDVSVSRQVVMVTEALCRPQDCLDRVESLLDGLAPEQSQRTDRTLVQTWSQVEKPFKGAQKLEGAIRLCNAIDVGPVVHLSVDGKISPAGTAVDAAIAALHLGLPGRTALSGEAAVAPEVTDWLHEAGGKNSLVPGPRVAGQECFLLDFEGAPSPPEVLATPMVGQRDEELADRVFRDRFQLRAVLGRGGGGTVYDALDRSMDMPVVVKVLRTELAKNPHHLQRFFTEARISAALRHPNVVNTIDFGHSEDGHLYLAMEKLRGRELSEELDELGCLPPRRAIGIAAAVLSALESAHEVGLIHRDIKPSNIFLNHQSGGKEQVKLIDFGVAVDLAQGIDPEEAGFLVGTLRYMSPEQFTGAGPGIASDLYALGIVLYKCLVGKVPFQETQGMALLMRRLETPVPELGEVCMQAHPRGLAAVLSRALVRQPEERYPNVAAMRRDLEAVLANSEDEESWLPPKSKAPPLV